MTLFAAHLIAAIAAIVIHVTAPAFLNAFAVAARELIGATCFVAIRLIAAIQTVLGVIANPRQRYAFAIVAAACEIIAGAAFVACEVWCQVGRLDVGFAFVDVFVMRNGNEYI